SYTLALHDALPISSGRPCSKGVRQVSDSRGVSDTTPEASGRPCSKGVRQVSDSRRVSDTTSEPYGRPCWPFGSHPRQPTLPWCAYLNSSPLPVGGARPRCRHVVWVAMRPRGVRCR